MSATRTRIVDGVPVFWKVCRCGAEGIAGDGPDALFRVKSRKAKRVYFAALCLDCERARDRERAAVPAARERRLARRRESYRLRMLDPELRERDRRERSARAERERVTVEARRRHAEAQRRYKARVKMDARRYEADLETRRLRYALRAEEEGRVIDIRRVRSVRERRLDLLSEPFREWLGAYMTVRCIGDVAELARDLGLVERRVRYVMSGGQRFVSVVMVDKALTFAAVSVEVAGRVVCGISDLYPELDEAAA